MPNIQVYINDSFIIINLLMYKVKLGISVN